MKILHISIMILSSFALLGIVLLPNVAATVPLVEIKLSGTANNQNCENNCVISQTVTVQRGTAVEWINNDLVPHILVSGKPEDNDNGTLFDSGQIWVGKFVIHNFNDVGVYHYFERDHPENTGIINVIDFTYPKLLSKVMAGSNTTSIIESPLKQFESGIAAKDVKCKEGLQFIMKKENGQFTCVTSHTFDELLDRGWGIIPLGGLSTYRNPSNDIAISYNNTLYDKGAFYLKQGQNFTLVLNVTSNPANVPVTLYTQPHSGFTKTNGIDFKLSDTLVNTPAKVMLYMSVSKDATPSAYGEAVRLNDTDLGSVTYTFLVKVIR